MIFKVNPKLVSDSKYFWQTIKRYFSDKGNFSNKIVIPEKVDEERGLSEIFNKHFIHITKTLDLKSSIFSTTIGLPEITEPFKGHPRIKHFSLCWGECQIIFHSVSEID